jgi:hypothetical protein
MAHNLLVYHANRTNSDCYIAQPINLKLCVWWFFTILLQAYDVLRCQIPSEKTTFEKLTTL